MIDLNQKHLKQVEDEQRAFGHVKPLITLEFQGQRIVAVGNSIHASESWKTFPDFLFYYIKNVLDPAWGNAELAKPEDERHPIIHWHTHLCALQKLQHRDSSGLYRMTSDGISTAYLMLAYDLYVLRHHQRLHDIVVRRLKQRDQFQGARYELFVAATLIRAGCDLTLENEADSTSKHPELVATHRRTGSQFDVEAKSRHRPGVLGHSGSKQHLDDMKLGLHRLLNRGAEKASTRPLVIFVDLNLPPEFATTLQTHGVNEFRNVIGRLVMERHGAWPFALAVISNNPHHYGEFAKANPLPWMYMNESDGISLAHQHIVADDIEEAFRQSGNIPSFFPVDFHERVERESAEPLIAGGY
jgi:hypothetical protein